MKNHIILVYGMPCVGKTTTCEQLALLGYTDQINADRVREQYFPQPDYGEQESNQVFEYLFARLGQFVGDAYPFVVIDSMFATGGRIIRIKEFAAEKGYQVDCIFLHASLEVLLDRNEQRLGTSKHMPPERITMFLNRFNSASLSDLSIDTALHNKLETAQLITTFLSNGR